MSVTLNFDDIDSMADATVEAIINTMDKETILAHINTWQNRLVSEKQMVPSEQQNRAALLLARRLRSMREESNKGVRAAKKAVASEAQPFNLGKF